jgi:glutathione S-transferase
MLILYEVAISPFVQKVKIALREKGIPFIAQPPGRFGVDHEFSASSPRGEVPLLADDDCKIFDSTIILDYLEDRWPIPPLLPAVAAERARVRMLEEICDTQFESINYGLTEVVMFQRANGALAEQLIAKAKNDTDAMCHFLSRALGERLFFDGLQPGRADIGVFPHLNNAAVLGNGPAPGSSLDAWLRRMRERPSVEQTVAEAKASVGIIKRLAQRIAEGKEQRLYRDHRLEWILRSGGLPIVDEGLQNRSIRFSPTIR